MSTQTYYIKGMHCASCELLIEKKLLEQKNIKAVDASTGKGEVVVEYVGEKLSLEKINQLFSGDGYKFSEQAFVHGKGGPCQWCWPVVIASLAIAAFLWFGKLGLASVINVSSNSSLPTFFIFGLIAGVSSCAALIGGLVLSMAKQWEGGKYAPHLLFNLGRVISYGLFGAALGLVGGALSLSGSVTSILVLIVSVIMAILALQMLGVKALSGFRFALPKSVTHKIASGKTSHNRYSPFVVGFLTFFLPCGFTIVAQGVAVLSGSPLRGGLIMASFALGTFIPLLVIGLSSAKLLSNKKWSDGFLKTAGLLVLFFVLFNLNLQFNFGSMLKGPTLNANSQGRTLGMNSGPIQVLKTTYTNSGDIQPNTFVVKVGQQVRMEVEAKETAYGCMSTIMIPGLFNQALYLEKDETLVMEFVPQKAGNYRITCAMGVPRGVLTVTN